jgi:integrase
MALQSTDMPGIRFRLQKVKGDKTGRLERCYYARVKRGGRYIDVKVGTESQGATPARAAKKRLRWQTGADPLPQDENRRKKAARAREAKAKAARMTYGRLWGLWLDYQGDYPQLISHRTAWHYRLKSTFENLTPAEITPEKLMQFKKKLAGMKTVSRGAQMHLDAMRRTGDKTQIEKAKKRCKEQQKPLSYATQAHALKFLRRLTNWAIKKQLVKHIFIDWDIKNPTKTGTDNLTRAQIQALIEYCNESHKPAAKMVLLALYTGARRTEILNLKWSDIDFDLGVIRLGVNLKTGTTKGGGAQDMAPLNSYARAVLEKLPKISDIWVLPSPHTAKPYNNPDKALKAIKNAVGLPDDFRILHGCRHIYATYVGTIGDAFAVQDLLHHKNLETSKIYTHLPADHLRQISERVAAMYHAPADAENRVIDFNERRKA